MKELIKAENISLFRHGKAVLDSVSLDINPGDFITIVGPNGAGKTTLLKALMGVTNIDDGRLIRSPHLKTGYVPQRLHPDQAMPITTGRFLTLRKKSTKENRMSAIEETGIENLLPKPLHVLSGGELQKVLLARALIGNPDLLVLDEPAQNLDISGQLALYGLIDRIYKNRNLTILMVSHDLHLVMSSTRQVVCLFHHISCSGEPSVIAADPEFKSLFGEDMAKMMSIYTHSPAICHDCESHDHTRHQLIAENEDRQ